MVDEKIQKVIATLINKQAITNTLKTLSIFYKTRHFN